MKKWLNKGFLFALALAVVLGGTFIFGVAARVQARESDVIKNGIYAGDIDLSGLNAEEAKQAINAYIETLRNTEITLLTSGNTEVVVKAGEFGLVWENTELIEEALNVGIHGNVIERYKIMKDLEHDNLVYPIEIAYDIQAISDVLATKGSLYDVKAVDFDLTRENGEFRIIEGQTGYALDVEESIDIVSDFMFTWDRQPGTIALDVEVTQQKGSTEELAQVTDVLGTFTTEYKTSSSSRSANVENGANLLNGILLYPGEELSTLELVTPFTVENGYYMAGSYLNGQVVDSLGGGICQVSTTLYGAVLQAELEVTQRYNHSMTVAYVNLSADAAIAESAGKDFCFANNTDYPIYIEAYTKDKTITFNIYGKETRSADREVSYETVVLQVIDSFPHIITPDAGQPIGYITASSGYVGYKAQLWKVVKENGVEVSRTQVNSSNYKMVNRTATVGVATGDSWAYEEIMAAIGTANIDHVRNVIAILTAPPEEEY